MRFEGIKTWKPNKKQEQFLRIPYSVFEAFYGGAVFGGKSEILLMIPLVSFLPDDMHLPMEERRRLIDHPNFNSILFRRTFPELEESLIYRSVSDGYYSAAGGEYNKNDHVWTFPSGAKVRFGYCTEDKDARSHDTAEFHYMAFDELTHFNEYQYRYLTHRVRSSRSNLPAFIRSASNPGNIGHAWVRKRFIDPSPQGLTLIKDKFTQTSRIFIPAKLEDNTAGLEANPNYVNTLNVLPEAERKAKREGDWYVFSGQVFTEFRDIRIPGEPKEALHVISPFDIPDWWPKLLIVDWGFVHPTFAAWIALSPDKRLFVYREYTCEKTRISEWASDLSRISQFDENILQIVMDPSAWQDRGQPQTIAAQFMDASGFVCEKADNDRLGGKMLLHEYMRWQQKPPRYIPKEGYSPEKADRIYRIHGELARDEYLRLFMPPNPETNLPILQIFSTCPKLIETIKLCIYNEKKRDDPSVKAEDVAKFPGDDAYDVLRYAGKEVEKYWDGLDKKYEEVVARQEILRKRDQTKDQTAFYQAMAALEKRSGQGIKPFRLH